MKKQKRQIKRVLIANRGEIAVRIAKTLKEMGIVSIAVASDPDRTALHARTCDIVVPIGGETSLDSYLIHEKILEAAKKTNADAIHPGYGFLAENSKFAQEVISAGMIWIGPPPRAIDLMGDKLTARETMMKAGVPVVPGTPEIGNPAQAEKAAEEIGYPIMIKATAGGGGKGMRIVESKEDLKASFEAASRESLKAFGNGTVFLEKFIERPRHIEFQVMADSHGNAVHLFERECSIQRRHQKIVEETPSVALDDKLRAAMGEAAVEAAMAADYVNAGTVEFILGQDGKFYFLEMNTRLQVEHPITEMTCGVDLVRCQINVAQGLELPWKQKEIKRRGHSIECRVYAEDPAGGFLPNCGEITALKEPAGPGIRNDTGVYEGTEVSIFYDPMLSKLIVYGEDRLSAIDRMAQALKDYHVLGVSTSIPFLVDVIEHPAFLEGDTCTDFIPKYMNNWQPKDDDTFLAALLAMAAQSKRKKGTPHKSASGDADFSVWQAIGSKEGR